MRPVSTQRRTRVDADAEQLGRLSDPVRRHDPTIGASSRSSKPNRRFSLLSPALDHADRDAGTCQEIATTIQ